MFAKVFICLSSFCKFCIHELILSGKSLNILDQFLYFGILYLSQLCGFIKLNSRMCDFISEGLDLSLTLHQSSLDSVFLTHNGAHLMLHLCELAGLSLHLCAYLGHLFGLSVKFTLKLVLRSVKLFD
jgi:hypothetical protein